MRGAALYTSRNDSCGQRRHCVRRIGGGGRARFLRGREGRGGAGQGRVGRTGVFFSPDVLPVTHFLSSHSYRFFNFFILHSSKLQLAGFRLTEQVWDVASSALRFSPLDEDGIPTSITFMCKRASTNMLIMSA